MLGAYRITSFSDLRSVCISLINHGYRFVSVQGDEFSNPDILCVYIWQKRRLLPWVIVSTEPKHIYLSREAYNAETKWFPCRPKDELEVEYVKQTV